ncbi:MAG: hypothetical protein ACRD59_04880 [Candidatus Acidiferrales bacterium]
MRPLLRPDRRYLFSLLVFLAVAANASVAQATNSRDTARCHFTFYPQELDKVSTVEAIQSETRRTDPWRNSPQAVAQKALASIDSAAASAEMSEGSTASPVSERRFTRSTESTRYDVTVIRPAATPGSGIDDESARWYVARIVKLECPAGITVEEAMSAENQFFRIELPSGAHLEHLHEGVALEANPDAHASAVGCPVFTVSYLSNVHFSRPSPAQKQRLLDEAQELWPLIQEDAERSGLTVASITSLGEEHQSRTAITRDRYEQIAVRGPDGAWQIFAGFSADGRSKLVDQYCPDFRRAQ